jgi:Tfp pilus assembly protein PilN
MKRMNLLPPELRPRDGRQPGSSYVVVAALAAAILAMGAYGLVISGVRSDEGELSSLKAEAEQAQAQADALGPYARFAEMKETRAQSVRGVAESRFDYERLTRELARILPDGVSISSLDVGPGSQSDADIAKGADTLDPVAAGPPTMALSGCAPSQDAVADSLDRLRALTGASAVELGSSGNGGGGTAGPAPAGGADQPYLVQGAGGGGSGCGGGGAPVSFDAKVTLAAGTAPQGSAGS